MSYNNNKTYLIIGTGRSGIAAARLLSSEQCSIILYDDKEDIDIAGIKDKLGINKTEDAEKVMICTGSIPEDMINRVDEVIVSPGVPLDCDTVLAWKNRGVNIAGEIELAYRYEKGKVVAITGTNGKTTTTSLMGEIMKKRYNKVFVAGNIGYPYTDMVADTDDTSCSVLEVSSFQLETIGDFRPAVSAILNITPDHLNRHHTMDNYIKAKLNIASNQTKDDVIVLNHEDEVLKKAASELVPRVIFFSSARELDEGVYLKDGTDIIINLDGKNMHVCNVNELILPGIHNYENVMAAVAMAYAMGVSVEDIHDAVTSFKSVEHRIEYVCEKDGVIYYNDSKGTNPDAAIKGIQAMSRPTYLIGGGYDKGADFTEWINAFDGKVKELVLIGETAGQIAETCDKTGFNNYTMKDSLEQAVEYCRNRAVSGDAVLLSPACASWDMFKSFEERGDKFKEYVLI